MAIPYEQCLKNNISRDRVVPEEVIKRMYMNFNIPYWYEGWNEIRIVGEVNKKYNVDEMVNMLIEYDQGNSHHTLTLGEHLWTAYDYYCRNYMFDYCDSVNTIATVLHDISKPFCRTSINCHGVNDGEIHYYNHQYVSAYDSLFINHLHDKLDVAIRIMWHMQPYFIKEQKTLNKYRKLWGEKLYKDIMRLHEADKNAH
jgi:hypothetical protein